MSKRLVFGFGITDEPASHGCPYYSRWKGVLRRCYSQAGDIPASYDGCEVADEWRYFSNFKRWMAERPWPGNHLDKDILRPGGKLYCPETAVFVPQYINTLMSITPPGAKGLPSGVIKLRDRKNLYMAMIRVRGGEKAYLGTFTSADDAHEAWVRAKVRAIHDAIEWYRSTDRHDERVCEAMSIRALELQKNALNNHLNRRAA